jgi:hypothetical protein
MDVTRRGQTTRTAIWTARLEAGGVMRLIRRRQGELAAGRKISCSDLAGHRLFLSLSLSSPGLCRFVFVDNPLFPLKGFSITMIGLIVSDRRKGRSKEQRRAYKNRMYDMKGEDRCIGQNRDRRGVMARIDGRDSSFIYERIYNSRKGEDGRERERERERVCVCVCTF